MAKTSTPLGEPVQIVNKDAEQVRNMNKIIDNTTANTEYLNARLVLIKNTANGLVKNIHIEDITHIDIKRDYINACADEIHVSFLYSLGDYVYDILPIKDTFHCILSMDNLDGNGNLYRVNNYYRPIFLTGIQDLLNPEISNVGKEQLDCSKVINVTCTLVPFDYLLIESLELDVSHIKGIKFPNGATLEEYGTRVTDVYRVLIADHFARNKITYNCKRVGSEDYPLDVHCVRVDDLFYDYINDVKTNHPDKFKAVFLDLMQPFLFQEGTALDNTWYGSAVKSIAEWLEIPIKKARGTPLNCLSKRGFIRQENHDLYPVPPGTYLQNYIKPKNEYTMERYGDMLSDTHEVKRTIFVYPTYQISDPLPPLLNRINTDIMENNPDGKTFYVSKEMPYLKCFIPNEHGTFAINNKTYWYDFAEHSLSIIGGKNTKFADYTDPQHLTSPEVYNVINTSKTVGEGLTLDTNAEDGVSGQHATGELRGPDGTLYTGNYEKATRAARVSDDWVNENVTTDSPEDKTEDKSWIEKTFNTLIVDPLQSLTKAAMNAIDVTQVETKRGRFEVEAEALSKKLIFFDIEWVASNPDLIYPGMPISITKFNRIWGDRNDPHSVFDVYNGRVSRTYTSYDKTRRSMVTRVHCLCVRLP